MKNKKTKSNKKNKILKRILTILIILLLIIILLISAAIIIVKNKINLMQQVELDESTLEISENINLTGFRNIAVFGVDSRENDYGKGNRSDCIMIISINNDTREINLVSIYRDTYLKIDGYGFDKITHAYSYGGAELALKTLNQNLDLNITEFVTVNFTAVSDVVDALGGVEITIDDEEVKIINEYIDETAEVAGKGSNHITEPGTYNLDGVQAVTYARLRKTAGGDYKRTERMRTVLTKMFEKIKTKNIKEINEIADKVLPEIYTNLKLSDIISLVPFASSFNINKSIGWPYETEGATVDKIWYGAPVTLEANVRNLHQEIFNDEEYEVPTSVKTISKQIANKTGYKTTKLKSLYENNNTTNTVNNQIQTTKLQ